MTGYVMAPTPTQAAEHIEKWEAMKAAGVTEGMPAHPVQYQQNSRDNGGRWVEATSEIGWWRSVAKQGGGRYAYRLVPLPPSPETVVVVDANTAHALIGRSVGGRLVTALNVYPKGVEFMSADQFITGRNWGESVTLDPLPAHPPEEEVETVRVPQSVGDAMRLIGSYTESEGGAAAALTRRRLFDAYEAWCHQGRPEGERTRPHAERAMKCWCRDRDDVQHPARSGE